jgi:hypothetical protein
LEVSTSGTWELAHGYHQLEIAERMGLASGKETKSNYGSQHDDRGGLLPTK